MARVIFRSESVKAVQPRPHPFLRAAFPLLVVFLFGVFTGLPELMRFLHPIRPMVCLGGLGLIVLAVTGRAMKVLKSSIGRVLLLFIAWFILCSPLAIWRGGSVVVFVNYWSKSFLGYVLTAGLIYTAAQQKRIFHTIAYAVGFLACLALAFRHYDSTGRLSL